MSRTRAECCDVLFPFGVLREDVRLAAVDVRVPVRVLPVRLPDEAERVPDDPERVPEDAVRRAVPLPDVREALPFPDEADFLWDELAKTQPPVDDYA